METRKIPYSKAWIQHYLLEYRNIKLQARTLKERQTSPSLLAKTKTPYKESVEIKRLTYLLGKENFTHQEIDKVIKKGLASKHKTTKKIFQLMQADIEFYNKQEKVSYYPSHMQMQATKKSRRASFTNLSLIQHPSNPKRHQCDFIDLTIAENIVLPDRGSLAIGNKEGLIAIAIKDRITIYDGNTEIKLDGQEDLKSYGLEGNSIYSSLIFTSDDKYLVATNIFGQVVVWDVESKTVHHTYENMVKLGDARKNSMIAIERDEYAGQIVLARNKYEDRTGDNTIARSLIILDPKNKSITREYETDIDDIISIVIVKNNIVCLSSWDDALVGEEKKYYSMVRIFRLKPGNNKMLDKQTVLLISDTEERKLLTLKAGENNDIFIGHGHGIYYHDIEKNNGALFFGFAYDIEDFCFSQSLNHLVLTSSHKDSLTVVDLKKRSFTDIPLEGKIPDKIYESTAAIIITAADSLIKIKEQTALQKQQRL